MRNVARVHLLPVCCPLLLAPAGAFHIAPKYRSSLNGSAAGAAPPMRRHPPSPQVHVVKPRTTVFQCHKSRVKVGACRCVE